MGEIAQEWPAEGPDFNRWNTDLVAFAQALADAADEAWWACDWQLKYLELRIDTRDGGFVLFDRDHNVISPDRVIKAIAERRERFGTSKIRRPPVQGER